MLNVLIDIPSLSEDSGIGFLAPARLVFPVRRNLTGRQTGRESTFIIRNKLEMLPNEMEGCYEHT